MMGSDFLSLVWLVVSIGVGAAIGERIAKAKARWIGWPIGLALFIVLFGLGSVIINRT